MAGKAHRDQRGKRITDDGKTQRGEEGPREGGKLERERRNQRPARSPSRPADRARRQDRDGKRPVLAVPRCERISERPRLAAPGRASDPLRRGIGGRRCFRCAAERQRRPDERRRADVADAVGCITPPAIRIASSNQPGDAALDQRVRIPRTHAGIPRRGNRHGGGRRRERAAGEMSFPVTRAGALLEQRARTLERKSFM